jgi:ABC-type glycerol-3-phosphate transport system permease component
MEQLVGRVNLPHRSEAYILQECCQLRDEIWTRVEDQRATERYMLLACAVIYSFLVLQDGKQLSEEIRLLIACAWYVPPLLAFLAAARWCENVRLIHLIADYTERREGEIFGSSEGGWESYLKRLNRGRGPSVLVSGYYVAFWLFLVFSTMTIAAYQHSFYVTQWRLCAAFLIGAVAIIVAVAVIARPVIMMMFRLRASDRARAAS